MQATATPTEIPAAPTVDRSVENGQPLAARVNNQPILLSAFQAHVANAAQTLAAQETPPTSDNEPARLDNIRAKIFWDLVDQQLIEQGARQAGLEISSTELSAAEQQLLGSSRRDQLEQWLARNNLTYPQFLEQLRFQLLAGQLFEAVTQTVPSTAEQIRLTYLQVIDPVVADILAAKIAQGQPLTELAQEPHIHSQYLDWFPRQTGLIPTEVEAVAFGLQPGDISGPIAAATGYYLIKLEGKEADYPLTPEVARQLKQQTFMAWLQKQRAASTVEPFVALP